MKDKEKKLLAIETELRHLSCSLEVLLWDQEVMMPSGAYEERAEQCATLAKIHHQKITGSELGELMDFFGSTQDKPQGILAKNSKEGAILAALFRDRRQAIALPSDLVVRLTRESALSHESWKRAREEKKADIFLPSLSRLIELTREKAECLGYEENIYDALLDLFEPDMKTSEVQKIFTPLQDILRELCEEVEQTAEPSFLEWNIPSNTQSKLNHRLLKDMNYDFTRGRFDLSAHPFTITLGSNDVRITTRYDNYLEGFFGTLHEFGHALYELQIDPSFHGTLLSDGTSLTIHESQSRMWENFVGRSRPFWDHWFELMCKDVPDLVAVGKDNFLKGINRVKRGLLRVKSDEVSYGLHIILRFRLEQALLSGDLAVSDVSGAWSDVSEELLGIRPAHDAEGMLQDIHWSHASFGYFPTYALGNLCAAQLWDCIQDEIPDLSQHLSQGNYDELKNWLKSHVHHFGRSKHAREIIRDVTGKELGVSSFENYLKKKYRDIYS